MTEDTPDTGTPLIFITAGEPSGDQLGADLMAALTARTEGRIRFAGIGGPLMESQGLKSLLPMTELAVMGLVEVLPRARHLLRRIRETEAAARDLGPDAIVTVDAPGFNFRLAKRLHGAGMPLIHYVAPTVWAWRPGRARKIARFLDHLLVLLPFEPPYFEREGLACTFVGHPAVAGVARGDGPEFRIAHGIDPDAPLLAVLPGSRRGEVTRLLPPFGAAVSKLAAEIPGLHVVTVTVPGVHDLVADAVADWPVPVTVVQDTSARKHAFAAANAAIAASGTVTLELAAVRVPCVVAYRMAPLTMAIARALVKVKWVNFINLTLGRGVIPELIQEQATPDRLAAEAGRLLTDAQARDAQTQAIDEALTELGEGGPNPSDRAAEVVLSLVRAAAR